MQFTSFLAPTRAKAAITAACFLVFPIAILMRKIPGQWDILDLGEWSGLVVGVLVGVPMGLFDLATGSAFVRQTEGFLAFPSLPELAAAFVGDLVFFYLVACSWIRWRSSRQRD